MLQNLEGSSVYIHFHWPNHSPLVHSINHPRTPLEVMTFHIIKQFYSVEDFTKIYSLPLQLWTKIQALFGFDTHCIFLSEYKCIAIMVFFTKLVSVQHVLLTLTVLTVFSDTLCIMYMHFYLINFCSTSEIINDKNN